MDKRAAKRQACAVAVVALRSHLDQFGGLLGADMDGYNIQPSASNETDYNRVYAEVQVLIEELERRAGSALLTIPGYTTED